MTRAFVSLELPDGLKSAVRQVQGELQRRLGERELRWTPVARMHLTLLFLGDVENEAVPEMEAELGGAIEGVTPFRLCARGLGFFPDRRRPRVCWLGVEGEVSRLRGLQERIEEALVAWVPKQGRPFVPHLTLAKMSKAGHRTVRLLETLPEALVQGEVGEWRVEAVDLMRSRLLPEGARHELIRRMPLDG